MTGGAGFIGSTLVDRLIARGDLVTVVDNFDSFYGRERKLENLKGAIGARGFKLVEMDIRDRDGIQTVVSEGRPEVIVHLAAKAGVRPSIEKPGEYAAVNVLGTVHLLEAACGVGEKPKFVYASSSSVYGDREEAPFRETDAVDRPVSPYAATKRACELMAYTFHHLHGLDVTGLRFFTAYGPRNRPDLAVSKFAGLIERGEAVPMYGDGTTRRDYTYIDDIVDGVMRAMDRCAGHHLYNLGNSTPVSLSELIEGIGKALGKAPKIERLPEQAGDVRLTYADISLSEKELGYRPGTGLEEGLRRFVGWWRGLESMGKK